jgi:hypothetical protein
MNKSEKVSTNDDKFNDDITNIIKRVSNRTLEMKTNNVKLLNKIAFEMNNLLSKTQDIVKICLNDRSGTFSFFYTTIKLLNFNFIIFSVFIDEIDKIQLDFCELGKKLDEKFSNGCSNE